MKPLIGITTEFKPNALKPLGMSAHILLTGYTEAIRAAGGLPVLLPLAPESDCEETLGRLDGILFTGDPRDVPPDVLGQPPHPKAKPVSMERWESDVRWLHGARSLGLPVLGVCFGMQLVTVACGGSMVQDIADAMPDADAHITPDLRLDHEVVIEPDSLLRSMAPADRVTVRSTHHQAVDGVGPGFRIVGRADDGVVEAVEHVDDAFLLGVQWHPELSTQQPDWLLQGFVQHCTPGAPRDDD